MARLATHFAAIASVASFALAAVAANSQAVVKPISRGTYVAYGLDAVGLRIVDDAVERNASGNDLVLARLPQTSTGYLVLVLDVRNAGRIPENIPLLQASLRLADGSVIDPAVYGPYVGKATSEAPTSQTIAPHHALRLRIIIGDVPNDRRVKSILLNPNDATPAYRFKLGKPR